MSMDKNEAYANAGVCENKHRTKETLSCLELVMSSYQIFRPSLLIEESCD